MRFTTQNLTGERVLVQGTDSAGTEGSQVIDATQWNAVCHQLFMLDAEETYSEAVREFFLPLTDAAELLIEQLDTSDDDPFASYVLSEGVAAVSGAPEVRVDLSQDSIILRLLDAGRTDRLIWVDGGLEVLAYSQV